MSVNKAVLEAFKRFDVDESGSISREELVGVFKALDDSMDDAAIDELLSSADASGDGQLQVEEFLNWIFAEDAQALKLDRSFGGGPLSFAVAGCSRDLNGIYVQQPISFNHRPVFACAETKRNLFFHTGFEQWAIYWKPDRKASARLKTNRAPHLANGDAVWEVWVKKKGWVAQPDMTCTLEQQSVDAKLEKLAAGELPQGVPNGIQGGNVGAFRRQAELLNGRPVYYSAPEDNVARKPLYFVYVDQKNQWKAENTWMLCETAENDSWPWRTSEKTWCCSPDRVAWPAGNYSVEYEDAMYNYALPELVPAPQGWMDPDFPPMATSLGGDLKLFPGQDYKIDGKMVECVWLRALETSTHPVLFGEDTEPADICQGKVGDCWLVAAIAAVAEFPHYLEDHVFKTKDLSPDGKYEVCLYDLHNDKFDARSTFVVDDYIPCLPGTWYRPPAPVFAHGNGKLYAPILEKVFAKYHGQYAKLDGGGACYAIAMMTGGTLGKCYYVQHPYDQEGAYHRGKVIRVGGVDVCGERDAGSTKLGTLGEGATFEIKSTYGQRLQYVKMDGSGPQEGWISFYVAGRKAVARTGGIEWRFVETEVSAMGQRFGNPDPTQLDEDSMWKQIMEYDKSNYLMTCGIKRIDKWRRQYYVDGLVMPHAYSLIAAKEVAGIRLVCCRNPWGNEKEWFGPWCDASKEWEENPDVAEALNVNFKGDGLWWMEWEDFQWIFGDVSVVLKEMPTKRGSFETEADAASTARTARTSRRPKVPVTPSRRTVKPKPRRVEPIPVKPVVKPVNEVDDKPTWNEKHQCNQTWC